jgi:hypothetical protein
MRPTINVIGDGPIASRKRTLTVSALFKGLSPFLSADCEWKLTLTERSSSFFEHSLILEGQNRQHLAFDSLE